MQPDLLRRGRQDVPADDPEAAGGQTALRVQPKLGGQPVRDGRLRSGMPASHSSLIDKFSIKGQLASPSLD